MTKRFFFILFLGFSTLLAQKKAELTFKDGSKANGLAKINIKHEIEFKETVTDVKKVFDYHDVKHLKFKYDSIGIRYEYKIFPDSPNRKIRLLHLVLEGKINLYERRVKRKKIGMGFRNEYGVVDTYYIPGSDYWHTISYVSKDKQLSVKKVKESGKTMKKRIKNLIQTHFKDCPDLMKKINLKEFGVHEFKEVVAYYNSNCGD